jgi:hypothetical protein
MILATCFILLVVVLAWFALDRVKEKIQADVGDSLQIVLHTTRVRCRSFCIPPASR